MGREIKRVPLDFDWPLNKTWHGFLLPEPLRSVDCPAGADCHNGSTGARAAVDQVTHLLLMLDDDRRDQQRGRPIHPYFHGFLYDNVRPSEDIAEFGAGLAGREGGFIGHDAIDGWRALEKVIRAAGLDPDVWGICPACKGRAAVEAYPGQRADAEAWQRTEPPAGDGWQLWETVSEGSPISPVFAAAEELARWLAAPGNRDEMPYDVALRFVQAGWAPTFVGAAETGLMSGAEFVGRSGGVS